MPPKKAKGGGAKQKPKEEQREDALQAVILADTFERKFVPFTNDKPRCLLPLANTPLIEYTLEFAAQAGVQDVFVYCGAHTDQVEEYLDKSRWQGPTSPFESLEVVRSDASSVGDAMRDLDHRDIIKGDFLLVSGDVVANVALEPALAAHKARRAKDPNSIMTMVLRQSGARANRAAASHSRQAVFVIDPTADRCLHYEEIPARRRRRRSQGRRGSKDVQGGKRPVIDGDGPGHARITIDPELLTTCDEIDVRTDLIDPHIDICTPDVLSLWSDNFDYQTLRTSFLYGVLKDYELNGKKLHTHILTEGYAARVKSVATYDTVSRDIVEGWAYPMRPDSNLLGQSYRMLKGKIYTERGVALARSSRIVKRSAIGADTSVGEGSEISDSIIGRGCIIGKNVKINGSYIWNNTLIEDGAQLNRAIVASEAVIGKNVKLESGALVSFAVRVADDNTVTDSQRLALPEGDANKAGTAKASPGDLAYESDSSNGSDASDRSGRLYSHANLSSASFGSLDSVSTLHSEAESDLLSEMPDGVKTDRRYSMASSASDPAAQVARHDFIREVAASVLDGMSQSQSADVIHLDVMNQRLTADASDGAVREALVSAFMRRIFQMHLDEGAPAGEAANAIFKTYGPKILRQMGVRTGDGEDSREADEVDVLTCVERECQGKEKHDSVLAFAITAAYQADIVSEDAILRWWEESGGEQKPGRKDAAKLVEFLQQESESEEDEEEEEGSDEESDDE